MEGVGLALRRVDSDRRPWIFNVLIVGFLLEGEEVIEFIVSAGHLI